MVGFILQLLTGLSFLNIGICFVVKLFLQFQHPLHFCIHVEFVIRILLHLSDINWKASFSSIHQEEWSTLCRILVACPIGEQNVVQEIIPCSHLGDCSQASATMTSGFD